MSAKNSGNENIKLSPKYGLNPTIPVCFWCQEPKNEIMLMGRIDMNGQKDVEAPKHMIVDYDPCESCAEKWSQGVNVVEISETPVSPGQPGIHITDGGRKKLAYPTGRYVVIALEAAKNIFQGIDLQLGSRVTVMRNLFEKVFVPAMNADKAKQANHADGYENINHDDSGFVQ